MCGEEGLGGKVGLQGRDRVCDRERECAGSWWVTGRKGRPKGRDK